MQTIHMKADCDGPASEDLTRKRNLRSQQPFWAETPSIAVRTRAEPRHRHYDCVVIGGGVSGALVAQALARPGRRLLVVDRRKPGHGSTMASTAMIQHEIDVPLHKLAQSMGEADAMAAWRRSAKAVADLSSLAGMLGVNCAMERKKTLFLAGDEMGMRALKTETEMRLAAGLEADYLDHHAVLSEFGIDRNAAIVSNRSASCNPAQLAAGVLNSLPAADIDIVSPMEITDVVETEGEIVLATDTGRLITCGMAVFATGYEFLKRMQSPSHQVLSTWALASKPHCPRPAWIKDFLVWEASDPYLYFRSTPDGRLIAGGEDESDEHAHLDARKRARKSDAITGKLEALAHIARFEPAYRWSALFGATRDGLPIIDRAPGMDNVFAVMGFGGNGLTFSMIAAQIMAAEANGKPDPDARLFRFR
jgi:glycine/D-amino acid oxidase-like deaminating enzyme